MTASMNVLGLWLAAIVLVSVSCDTDQHSPGDRRTVDAGGALLQGFETVEGITRASDAVIVGKVVERSDRPTPVGPHSAAKVVVETSLKGTLTPGQTITVVEFGGLFPESKPPDFGRATPAPTRPGEPLVEYTAGGVPVLKPGGRYLLFLTAPVPEPVGAFKTGDRGITAASIGRMLVGQDDVLHYPGNPTDLEGADRVLQRSLAGRPLAEASADIRAAAGLPPCPRPIQRSLADSAALRAQCR